MMAAADDQRRRAMQWRAVVALLFRSAGIADAAARIPGRRAKADPFSTEPDVYAPSSGLHIAASPVPWERVSTFLNRAVVNADDRGAGDLPVLILPRQQHEPADAYAVLRASDLARLALDAARGREAVQTAPEG